MDALLHATLFETGTQLTVALLVLFAAQAIYALYGFGSGILSLAVLAFVFPDLSTVVVLLLLVNLPTEAFVVWRDRQHVARGETGRLLASLALTTPLGALLLRAGVGDRWPFLALGALLIVFSFFFLGIERLDRERRLPAGSAWMAGAASGLLAGLFGAGGPPLILYFRLRGVSKSVFRATLLAIFLATSAFRVPAYALGGLAGVSSLLSALVVLPACLAGLAVGHRLHRGSSERGFRRGTAVAVGLLGILLLVRG